MTDFHTGYGGWHAKGLNASIYETLRDILRTRGSRQSTAR